MTYPGVPADPLSVKSMSLVIRGSAIAILFSGTPLTSSRFLPSLLCSLFGGVRVPSKRIFTTETVSYWNPILKVARSCNRGVSHHSVEVGM